MKVFVVVGAGGLALASGLALAEVTAKPKVAKVKVIQIPKEMDQLPLKLDPKARPVTSGRKSVTVAGSGSGSGSAATKTVMMNISSSAVAICQTQESCEAQGLILDPNNCLACISADDNCYIVTDGTASTAGGGGTAGTGSLYWGSYVLTNNQHYLLVRGTVYQWGSYDVATATRPVENGGLGCALVVKKKLPLKKPIPKLVPKQ